jgi:hypothetical protein
MIEHEPNMRALKREWSAARFLGALAGLILAAVGATAAIGWWQSTTPDNAPHTISPRDAAATPVLPEADARRAENVALCTAALSAAQTLGLVPNFATLDGGDTKPTGVQGRYACNAKTDAAKYAVTFDLACTNLAAGNCIVLDNVTQDGNTVIYQRS